MAHDPDAIGCKLAFRGKSFWRDDDELDIGTNGHRDNGSSDSQLRQRRFGTIDRWLLASARSTTQRLVLHCQNGIRITAERGANFQLIDRKGDGTIDAVSLDGKAMLLDVDSRRVKNGFEVITPQAIAAVRGTRWAIDVGGGKTSVLVLRGRVSVRRADAQTGVVLARGQGVDVDSGSQPLVVKQWPPARVSALMGRLER